MGRAGPGADRPRLPRLRRRPPARQALAPRTEMRRSAADDDPANRPGAPIARLAGPLVDLEVLLHRAVAVGRGVIVDGAAAPLDRLGQDVAQRPVKPPGVVRPEALRVAERMEPRPPERFVGVDVAHAGNEILVEQQGLEAASAPREQPEQMSRGEVVGERLGTRRKNAHGLTLGRQARDRVAAIQAHPPELADVAEADLAAIGQSQDDVDVPILRRTGRHHE